MVHQTLHDSWRAGTVPYMTDRDVSWVACPVIAGGPIADLEDDQLQWKCEFCGHRNVITVDAEEIPTEASVDYIEEVPPTAAAGNGCHCSSLRRRAAGVCVAVCVLCVCCVCAVCVLCVCCVCAVCAVCCVCMIRLQFVADGRNARPYLT